MSYWAKLFFIELSCVKESYVAVILLLQIKCIQKLFQFLLLWLPLKCEVLIIIYIFLKANSSYISEYTELAGFSCTLESYCSVLES